MLELSCTTTRRTDSQVYDADHEVWSLTARDCDAQSLVSVDLPRQSPKCVGQWQVAKGGSDYAAAYCVVVCWVWCVLRGSAPMLPAVVLGEAPLSMACLRYCECVYRILRKSEWSRTGCHR